jgi:hypothetical protein
MMMDGAWKKQVLFYQDTCSGMHIKSVHFAGDGHMLMKEIS